MYIRNKKIPETSVVYFPELYLNPLIDHLCWDLTISPHVGQLPNPVDLTINLEPYCCFNVPLSSLQDSN